MFAAYEDEMAQSRHRRPRDRGDFSGCWSPRQAYEHVQRNWAWHCSVSLELDDYLRELGAHAAELRQRETLPLRRFIELLEAPLLRPIPSPSPSASPSDEAAPGYRRWDQAVQELATDFEAMKRAGVLEQDGLWLFMCGADGPSGMHWYNFDIPGFLSAGAAASFHAKRVQSSTITWDQCASFLYLGGSYE